MRQADAALQHRTILPIEAPAAGTGNAGRCGQQPTPHAPLPHLTVGALMMRVSSTKADVQMAMSLFTWSAKVQGVQGCARQAGRDARVVVQRWTGGPAGRPCT